MNLYYFYVKGINWEIDVIDIWYGLGFDILYLYEYKLIIFRFLI